MRQAPQKFKFKLFQMLLLFLFTGMTLPLEGAKIPDEDFFNLKKFAHSMKYFANPDQLESIVIGKQSPGGKGAGRRMKVDKNTGIKGAAEALLDDFAKAYITGFHELDKNDLRGAIRSFEKARTVWPEFFYVDFIIAILYEIDKEYQKSASYYKSYIEKLKRYHKGEYKISKQIINFSMGFAVESVQQAERLITWRMQNYGVDFTKAKRPPQRGALYGLFRFIGIGLLIFLSYAFFKKYFYKIKNIIVFYTKPPPDSWLCTRCWAINVRVQRECFECGNHYSPKSK